MGMIMMLKLGCCQRTSAVKAHQLSRTRDYIMPGTLLSVDATVHEKLTTFETTSRICSAMMGFCFF
jgi:hypothetical protein